MKRQREDLAQTHLRVLRMRLFLRARLKTDVQQHQYKREIAQPQNQIVLARRIGERVGEQAA